MHVDVIRESILKLKAYTLEARDSRDKLDQNESPFDFPAALKEEVIRRGAAHSWNRYPDFELVRLRKALALFHGLEMENILVGNGSNELLLVSLATLVAPGSRLVFPSPTFTLYEKFATILGADSRPIPLDPFSGRLPTEEILAEVERSTAPAVIVICSPNNPTGGSLSEGDLDRLLASGAFVLLDRAYGEFGSAHLPPLHPRLITLSTFSKAWGLAGLRIGWLSTTEETCSQIRKVKLPYNLNVISEEAAIIALENPEVMEASVAHVIAERTRVAAALGNIEGVTPYPSESNFVAFRLATDAKKVFAHLVTEGVLVRDISAYPRMEGSLRVSIGTIEENDRFIDSLRRALSQDTTRSAAFQAAVPPASSRPTYTKEDSEPLTKEKSE
ncbi:MAG TPA: histidinol-phosphate transaminase [Thermoanaerobaculia bacterium]|nr:histidinol-phosphate transaminase [Thermoanaerobaculia bacterium]